MRTAVNPWENIEQGRYADGETIVQSISRIYTAMLGDSQLIDVAGSMAPSLVALFASFAFANQFCCEGHAGEKCQQSQ